ncbi:hypothetical protein [Psychromonas arctica]|uniref:hypothetical protein n=1 Tax=Psychromonas arctica TaxID=168275 RepID=UPI002FD16F9A
MSNKEIFSQWQPARTAPKDEVFIAIFECSSLPVLCTWNEPESQWIFSVVQVNLYQGKWNDTFFDTEYETAGALIAWMPLPTVNERKK